MMERAGFHGCRARNPVWDRADIPASDEEMVILHIAHGDGADGFVPPGDREGQRNIWKRSKRSTQGDGRRRCMCA